MTRAPVVVGDNAIFCFGRGEKTKEDCIEPLLSLKIAARERLYRAREKMQPSLPIFLHKLALLLKWSPIVQFGGNIAIFSKRGAV